MITVEQLRNYLGVDSESDVDITFALNSALETLKRVTGRDWSKVKNNAIAIETIQSMVYLNYWGIRDSAKNTDFLQKFITQKISLLQYCDDVEVVQSGI